MLWRSWRAWSISAASCGSAGAAGVAAPGAGAAGGGGGRRRRGRRRGVLQRLCEGDRGDATLDRRRRVGRALRLRGGVRRGCSRRRSARVARRGCGRRRSARGARRGCDPARRGGSAAGSRRRSGRNRAADDLAEPQLRGLTEVAGLITFLAGDRDGEVAAVEHHLGAADAKAVDPILDDLLGLQELLPRRLGPGLGACLQSDTRATLQIDPELWCGPAVAGEEHQCVEHDDDAEERTRGSARDGSGPGWLPLLQISSCQYVRIVSCGRSRSRSRPSPTMAPCPVTATLRAPDRPDRGHRRGATGQAARRSRSARPPGRGG